MKVAATMFALCAIGFAAWWFGSESGLSDTSTQVPVSKPTVLDLQGFKDIDGRPVRNGADVRECEVIFFVTTDCPIGNRYAPELQRIVEDYKGRGVDFLFVYPNKDDSVEDIRQHVQEYSLAGTIVRDVEHVLVSASGATVTPEAAVYNKASELEYLGRIDNWYVDFGKNRKEPTVHDVRDAIEAVLNGKPVDNPKMKAVGCYIAD